MIICNCTTNSCASTCRAIVWTLWSRFTAINIEAYWLSGGFSNPSWLHKGVLLFNAKPRIVFLVFLHCLCTSCPGVANGGLSIPGILCFSNDKDVWCTTEWISKNATGMKKDLRVMPLCLLSAAAIIVPDAEFLHALGNSGHCHGLGARNLMGVKPDILGQDTALVTRQGCQRSSATLLSSWGWGRWECRTCGLHDDIRHCIRVTICSRSPVFHVPLSIF